MNEDDIPVKTPAGVDELRARTQKLAPRLRTMLVLVDGSLSVAQLRSAATTLGAPEDFLRVLEQQGLVERRQALAARTQPGPSSPMPLSTRPEQATAPVPVSVPTLPLPHFQPQRTDAERFRIAQKLMNDSVVDALGIRAFFFTLKLEKAATVADLRALLPDFDKAITKGSGDATARILGMRARDILG